MLEFMSARSLCVISTVDQNCKPESAMVAYVHDGLELYIGTSNKSRKFKNILENGSVAVVIADLTGEVQYEGQAQIVSNDDLVANEAVKNLPGFTKYRDDPDQSYVHITPTWIRFIEHGEQDNVEEFTEF